MPAGSFDTFQAVQLETMTWLLQALDETCMGHDGIVTCIIALRHGYREHVLQYFRPYNPLQESTLNLGLSLNPKA